MKKISRNIYTHYSYSDGILYSLRVRGKNLGLFLTKEMAEEARMDFDFEKWKWSSYTKDVLTKIPDDFEIHSKLVLHPNGKWYVKLPFKDDILVSDLYSTKKEAEEIKEYLDENRWSIESLNHQKWERTTCARKYSGILPTREGYLVVSSEKKEYGLFQTLKEAEDERNKLRSRGIVI